METLNNLEAEILPKKTWRNWFWSYPYCTIVTEELWRKLGTQIVFTRDSGRK